MCLPAINFAHAEGLGRLFFTPAERAQLNHHHAVSTPILANANTGLENSGDEHSLTLNGVVQKDGGKRTVWINGIAKSVGSGDDNTSSTMVTLPDQNKMVRLKVGQRVLLPTPANPAKPAIEQAAPSEDD